MSYQIELRHLRYFLAVAEDLHFRKAAEKLFISQPGLSRQIKQMENDLGVQLFERHSRKVKLTKVGLYLKTEIARNLKSLTQILNHAKLLNNGIVGDLKFGYVGSAMQEIIPNSLLKFQKENPEALFGLKEMDNQRQIENLLLEDIDIGFVRLDRVPKGINMKTILTENFCLVLPKNHKVSSSNFESLNQLKENSFILFDPNYSSSYYEKVMQIFDDAGFAPIITHNTIHAGSIFKLVENNFGISIVPKSLQSSNQEGVKFIELKKITQKTTLSAVWNQENRNPMLKEFLKHI
jgi:DNA-binding transcriptional LysR family regulator